MGKLGRRRRREPYHLPGADPVPLAGTDVVLGDLSAGRAGFGRVVPGPVPEGRAGRPGPAVPAWRVPVLQPDRPGNGLRHPRRARPGRRDQPDVRAVSRGGGPDARGRLPDRARPCRGLAGLRRMAGQLRASGLRGGRRGLCRAGAVVRPAPALGAADPAKTSRTRPPTEVINGVTRGRRLAGDRAVTGCDTRQVSGGLSKYWTPGQRL